MDEVRCTERVPRQALGTSIELRFLMMFDFRNRVAGPLADLKEPHHRGHACLPPARGQPLYRRMNTLQLL